ncbi:MAG TPA: type II toxin-antitoxin system prevent-host-death family antitoxin [Geodermatophilus sp.]|nr:type II toxin-antitoxin system prevent-host-death family antitoxin [Geodermatophilus sp.]
MRVASRELRNDTAAVLRRAGAGESVVITVNGEPVAELGPLRSHASHWTARSAFLARLGSARADPGLFEDLRAISGGTGELGPIR